MTSCVQNAIPSPKGTVNAVVACSLVIYRTVQTYFGNKNIFCKTQIQQRRLAIPSVKSFKGASRLQPFIATEHRRMETRTSTHLL